MRVRGRWAGSNHTPGSPSGGAMSRWVASTTGMATDSVRRRHHGSFTKCAALPPKKAKSASDGRSPSSAP